MTDTTTGGHDQESEARVETTTPEPAEPRTEAPQPAASAPAQAPEPAPASAPVASTTPAPSEAQNEAPTPESAPRPTGTVYTPGQAPQPYVAPGYSHEPAATPASGQPAQAAQTAPTAPVAGAPAPASPVAPAASGGSGTIPPAFGGPAASSATPAPAKPRRVGLGVAAAIVAAALIGGASGAGVTALVVGGDDATTTQTSAGAERIVVNDTESVNQVSAVAASASPSVVTIEVAGAQGEGQGTGSGIILSEDGYVLTNTHVVTLDGATGDPTIQVKTDDGRLYEAELIGTDPLSDLAVIKLVDASDLTPIEFADSDELNVGDTAIAIGAPLGLAGTVTDGIISALNRSIDVESSAAPTTPDDGQDEGDESQQSPFDFWNFDGQEGSGQQSQSGGLISIPVIQTDAAINPGNSGGALLDSDGKLIGVNVAILSTGDSGQAGNIGVGFAVPSNLAERVANEIIENGAATHGLLGATVTSAQESGESDTVGALISEVSPGGAAESAGLQSGDVVTALNGVPISDQTDLTAQVRALAGGADAEVTYTRDGESQTVTVTLGTFEG
ncbi:trypsin-like peptidase domain-containing protein [Agromyces sp. NPDC056523]|uniref:S1C family serine protease n=1 Tax=Agromyces sp. NPDC056523 TaxID=3345850 RepID=UPI00366EDD7E